MKTHATVERRARIFWVSFILMFFAGQAVLWTYALGVVTDDPSHAVVEDYDSFATKWDQSKAQEASNEALGWSAELTADHERIVVRLTDRLGGPLDAAVTAKVFHKARAAEVKEVQFEPVEPGMLVGRGDFGRDGLWRVKLTATRGGDVFTDIQDVTVGRVATR